MATDDETEIRRGRARDLPDGMTPFDSAAAVEANRIRWGRRAELLEERPAEALVKAIRTPARRTLSLTEWDSVYVGRAFPGPWRGEYWRTLRELKKQYAPPARKGETAQYRILVEHAAALHVAVEMLRAQGGEPVDAAAPGGKKRPDADPYLILRTESELRAYVAQLQRYTEAEKRELTVTAEVIETTVRRVVAIAEATIDDASARAFFLRALTGALVEESLGGRGFAALPSPADDVVVVEGTRVGAQSPGRRDREIAAPGAPGDDGRTGDDDEPDA